MAFWSCKWAGRLEARGGTFGVVFTAASRGRSDEHVALLCVVVGRGVSCKREDCVGVLDLRKCRVGVDARTGESTSDIGAGTRGFVEKWAAGMLGLRVLTKPTGALCKSGSDEALRSNGGRAGLPLVWFV